MSVKIIQYAPVVIPTLNRTDKLKDCIESLELCTGANQTEIYVSVDYPPSEKYENGWIQVNSYLEKKQTEHKFKELIVIKRNRNLGLGHCGSNANTTLNELRTKYDRFIFTEDDNVFSPNFLEFVNKGLEKFKDDKRICYLSGYNYHFTFPEMYKNNYYITKDGSPWGMAGWFDRLDDIRRYQNLDFLKKILRTPKLYRRLKKRRPQSIPAIITMLKSGHCFGDTCIGCYAALEDKYWVLPTVSKVRNQGSDGSGAHTASSEKRIIDFFDRQEIDKYPTFEFTDDIFTYRPVEIVGVEIPTKWYKRLVKSIISKFDLFCIQKFGFVVKSKYI